MGVFKDRDEKAFEKQMNMQEPYQEGSDESMAFDKQQAEMRLPSNVMPEDYYQYKRFINLPESQAEFSSKIDKDVVFANIGGQKPTLEELRFQIGTIELFESEFVEEIHIPRKRDGEYVRDSEGRIVVDTELRFDPMFLGSLLFLKNQFKFDVVGSRAQGGQDRAAFLDISSSNRISKEFSKKKEQTGKFFGTGSGGM